ncbi:MAG: RusA family crossover junction endodeoxyribonuclease [Patescibacteria group bacterium]|nr:RusA family crossover junction endodeoxyribonuclease [Patescibacteria group bacterium]
MDEIILELPYPPSVNHYYKTVRTRKSLIMYIDQKGIDYRNKVKEIIIENKVKNCHPFHLPYFPLARLSAKFYVYPPDKRCRDLDNLGKVLLDSLQHALVYYNDNQIDQLYFERLDVIKGGKVTAIIKAI